ncbi:MAG: hypothetical protein R8K54_08660 [Mariprofundaceae bacterium]
MAAKRPVQLTVDDCMDAEGRATHGAVAEASMQMGSSSNVTPIFMHGRWNPSRQSDALCDHHGIL